MKNKQSEHYKNLEHEVGQFGKTRVPDPPPDHMAKIIDLIYALWDEVRRLTNIADHVCISDGCDGLAIPDSDLCENCFDASLPR
jgi:hypothetical protein